MHLFKAKNLSTTPESYMCATHVLSIVKIHLMQQIIPVYFYHFPLRLDILVLLFLLQPLYKLSLLYPFL